jgi:hypothetical protein
VGAKIQKFAFDKAHARGEWMALSGFRNKFGTVDDSRDSVKVLTGSSRLSSRAQGIMLAALIVIGGGSFGAIGYASAQSMADGEVEEAQPPEPASTAVAPLDVVAPKKTTPAQPVSAREQLASGHDAMENQGGDIAELQQMMKEGDLTELRTTYNGSYGASLLLSRKGLTYYTALIQENSFWRVIKTQDKERAEATYAAFVRRSVQLADVEVRRTQLAAEMAETGRKIALAEARAKRLQADLDIAHQQQTLFATRQKRLRQETAALDSEKRAAQDQLRESRRYAHMLQHEAEQGLPLLTHCGASHKWAKRGCK